VGRPAPILAVNVASAADVPCKATDDTFGGVTAMSFMTHSCAIILAWIVFGVLLISWLATQLRALRVEREARQAGEAVYSAMGGARLDILNVTLPFAALTATSTWVSLVVAGREYRFCRREVRDLSRYRSLWWTGLRIEHERTGYPTLVVFWTWNFDQLRAALEALGYVVRASP
jgi:hypothetical protein